MQLTTSNKRWLTNGRRVEASIPQMSSNIWISSERIRSFEITDTITDGNTIMIGTASSRSLTMELTNLTSTEVAGLYQYVRFNLLTNLRSPDGYTDMVNQGFFVVDSVEKVAHADGTFDATVQAYDFMYLLDKKCNLTPPNGYITIRQMITNILTALNIPNNGVSSTWSTNIKINSVPTDITYREFIGYLAGLQGCVAHFVPSNTGYIITYNYDVLTAMWFEDVIDPSTSQRFLIDATWQYAQGLSIDGNAVTINHIEGGITSDENDLYVYPDDATYNLSQTISFVNPYLDKTKDSTDASYTANARLVKIGESLGLNSTSIQYVPATVEWFGMPCIRAGHIVNVEERVTSSSSNVIKMYIMEKQVSFDGSLSETYKSLANTETGVNFNPTNLVQYVKHSVSVLEKEIEQATNVIDQTTGSVFELTREHEGDDHNNGFRIYSTNSNNVITGNSGGIGFSNDGGSSYSAAIYIDNDGGHIVGNYLVTGSVKADSIESEAITSDKIYAGAITSEKIQAGAITADKLNIGRSENIAICEYIKTGDTDRLDISTSDKANFSINSYGEGNVVADVQALSTATKVSNGDFVAFDFDYQFQDTETTTDSGAHIYIFTSATEEGSYSLANDFPISGDFSDKLYHYSSGATMGGSFWIKFAVCFKMVFKPYYTYNAGIFNFKAQLISSGQLQMYGEFFNNGWVSGAIRECKIHNGNIYLNKGELNVTGGDIKIDGISVKQVQSGLVNGGSSGVYTVNFPTAFSSNNYAVVCTPLQINAGYTCFLNVIERNNGSFKVRSYDRSGNLAPTDFMWIATPI